MIYAILDTNAGLLQWIGEASEEGEAYDLYAADIGHEAYDLLENSEIFRLTEQEAGQVQKWHDDGAISLETPDCIINGRRGWGR